MPTYSKLNIQEIHETIYKISNHQVIVDSLLQKVTYLNSMGRYKKREIRHPSGTVDTYDYIYRDDGKILETKATSSQKNKFLSHKKYKYNKENQLKEKQILIKNLVRTRIKYKYDKNGKLKEKIFRRFRSFPSYEKIDFVYDKEGRLTKRRSNVEHLQLFEMDYIDERNERIAYRYEKNRGRAIAEVKNYNERNQIIKEKIYCYLPFWISGLYTRRSANTGDILVKKYSYNKKGLLIEMRQWLNNRLIGVRKYRYVF